MNIQKHVPRMLKKPSTDLDDSSCSGMLFHALKKLLEHLHSSLEIHDDAVDFIERLCLRLMIMLCDNPTPRYVPDVEERVLAIFPTPIDKWALKDAKETLERGKKRSMLPVEKLHQYLQKLFTFKIDSCVTLFIIAIMEYVAKDILFLTANYVKNIYHIEITLQDVKIAMCTDKVLMDLFYQEEEDCHNFFNDDNDYSLENELKHGTVYSYERVVKELIADERQYLRDLHMIIKVFQEELKKIIECDLERIFLNILEIYELTVTVISNLEDVVEMAQEEKTPLIGSCMYELAEALEFDVYIHYAKEVNTQRNALVNLLNKEQVHISLTGAGQGFIQAVRYFLPKLLLCPLLHCYLYFDYLKLLHKLSPVPHDRESLQQVEGLLKPLETALSTYCTAQNKVLIAQARRRLTLEKLRDLQKTVENWELKDFGQFCNEFIKEDTISKYSSGKKISERRAILFDGILILCKHHQPSSLIHYHHHHHYSYREYRIKEKFYVRKVQIRDLADNNDVKDAFEIVPRNEPSIVLVTNNSDSKSDWIANLVMLNTKPMLDRILDNILINLEQQNPLKLPPVHLYRFAEPDTKTNIVFEQRESSGGVPLIKGATLLKLIERLTYHLYADMSFMRTFLTTYRSFCTPNDLLDLLIERFGIPEPNVVYGCEDVILCYSNGDMESSGPVPENWKRYRKEYSQPIKFRVLNVLKHWIEYHFYDFQNDANLLINLEKFLSTVSEKKMQKWADTLSKLIARKIQAEKEASTLARKFTFVHMEPVIEWHIKNLNEDEFGILTLHPLEFARQLTLLEYDLYRMVRPSELVGSVWTKKDKEITSPNLLKIIKHTTNFTRWLEKNIVEAENFEERVAIVSRILEIMMSLQDLNNFNGILAIVSAMGSASVFRLKCTFQALARHFERILDECRELNTDHFRKYQERLRTINPPCVPFLGMCLTNILHIEEGNPNFLHGSNGLINFTKRRKVAEITGEIQQFQNQAYCLQVEPRIRRFLDNLNPFGDMRDTDISNYLYDKSLDIEPRNCKQPPKFPRKWPDIPLKSPGIKPRNPKQYSNSTTPVKSDGEEISPSGLADTFMNTSQTPSPTHNSPSSLSIGAFSSIQNWFSSHSRSSSVISLASTTKATVVSPKSIATTTFVPSTCEATQSQETPPVDEKNIPPPLPPRNRRWDPSVIQETPPLVPPRDDRIPPPLPPRFLTATLPRLNPSTAQSTLLMRRSLAAAASSSSLSINSSSCLSSPQSPIEPSLLSPFCEPVPKLPPKPLKFNSNFFQFPK